MAFYRSSPFGFFDHLDYFTYPRYARRAYGNPYQYGHLGFGGYHIAPSRSVDDFDWEDFLQPFAFAAFPTRQLTEAGPVQHEANATKQREADSSKGGESGTSTPNESEPSTPRESKRLTKMEVSETPETSATSQVTIGKTFGEVSSVINDRTCNYCVALPGVSAEDVALNFDKASHSLTVNANRKFEEKKKTEFGEFTYSRQLSFSRRLPIPRNASKDQIKADFEDGSLKISVANLSSSTESVPVNVKHVSSEEPSSSTEMAPTPDPTPQESPTEEAATSSSSH